MLGFLLFQLLDLAFQAFASCSSQVTFPVTKSGITNYPKKATAFGIPLLASSKWTDAEVNHAASVMAKYIDNDEDGCPDDPKILAALQSVNEDGKRNVMMLLDTENDQQKAEKAIKKHYGWFQLTGHDEMSTTCSGLNMKYPADGDRCQDATLEEVFHFFTAFGVSKAYPKIWGETSSKLTNAMDKARGGKFKKVPKKYPKGAWYSYNDTTCNYNCMATEYIWWAYCAYSGICDARKNTTDFTNEFKFQTKKGLQSGDKMVTQLLENQNGYVFPLKHADGKYKGCGTCSTTGSVSVHAKEPKKSVCATIQKWATREQFSSKEEVKELISDGSIDFNSAVKEATGQVIANYSFEQALAFVLKKCPNFKLLTV